MGELWKGAPYKAVGKFRTTGQPEVGLPPPVTNASPTACHFCAGTTFENQTQLQNLGHLQSCVHLRERPWFPACSRILMARWRTHSKESSIWHPYHANLEQSAGICDFEGILWTAVAPYLKVAITRTGEEHLIVPTTQGFFKECQGQSYKGKGADKDKGRTLANQTQRIYSM